MFDLNHLRVLVTGGAGFIGSHFVDLLLERFPDIRVTTLDCLTYAGSLENLAGAMKDERHTFVQGDVCDADVVTTLVRDVDVIVHFAAETHVDRSLYEPDRFLRTDVLGTYQLLEAVRHHGKTKLFIHISTDEVYGSIDTGYAHEEAPFRPSSPYSASKAAADHLALAYRVTYGLPVIVVRPCNAFGPRQYPEKLIPFFTIRALQNQSLPLYGDGQNIRDWIYVRDLVEGIVWVILKGSPGLAYNIGAGNYRTNLEVARAILRHLDKSDDLIKFVKDRPGHDFRYALDWERLRRLGWSPRINFDEALARTIAWYRDHPDRWTRLLNEDHEFRRFYETHYHARLNPSEHEEA